MASALTSLSGGVNGTTGAEDDRQDGQAWGLGACSWVWTCCIGGFLSGLVVPTENPRTPLHLALLSWSRRASPPGVESIDHADAYPPSPEVVARLVASHRDFLSFLQARLPNRATAEEVLQAAFVRTLEKGGSIRDSESAVAWFYRLLRNALIDYYRSRASSARALEKHAAENELPPAEELETAVCACMNTLLPTLKPEYADMLRRIDLEEAPISAVAKELDITVNNATVRLHRARQALKRQLERSCGTCATHGCLDCSCGESACSPA
jgi:RNA polymerase sigma factor (sigma-70 family)